MSCLISFFVWSSPSCLQRDISWTFKMIIHATAGNRTSDPRLPSCHSNHSAIGVVDDMWIKLLQYLFTLRYYKNSVLCVTGYIESKKKRIIAYLQFRDWYHLNTRWFTQKKKFIMSYMSMTIYDINSFLFINVFIVCVRIYLLMLYICIG